MMERGKIELVQTREQDIVRTLEEGLFDGKFIQGVKVTYQLDRRMKKLTFIFEDGEFSAVVQVR